MFDKELQFFIDHQDEFVRKYFGKTLVLRGETVEGVYGTPLDAYLDAQKKFPLGTFMIQPCEPGPGAYTIILNT
jgi:hypothetical protein